MTMLVVLGVNLVMLWLLEVPLGMLPDCSEMDTRRRRATKSRSRHAHVFAVRGLAALGALVIIKGIVGLAS